MKNEKPIIYLGFKSEFINENDSSDKIIIMNAKDYFSKFIQKPTQAPPIINQNGTQNN